MLMEVPTSSNMNPKDLLFLVPSKEGPYQVVAGNNLLQPDKV